MSIVKANDLPQGFHAYEYILTGYRVNYSATKALISIFDKQHNEFWMIWTDIFPCMYFSCLYIQTCMQMQQVDSNIHGLYFGVITSRIFSALYHIFSCMSVESNRILLYLDMAGISNMAFGTPILYCNVIGDDIYYYLCTIFSLYSILIGSFIYCAIYDIDIQKSYIYCQSLLVLLVMLGSIPLWIVPYNIDFMDYYIATFFIVSGYIFYASCIPERILSIGISDGKLWNSHVIWHLARLYYIVT